MPEIITAETISRKQGKVLSKLSQYDFYCDEWCDCDETREEIFFEDEFFEGYIHHYRCDVCGRITEIE